MTTLEHSTQTRPQTRRSALPFLILLIVALVVRVGWMLLSPPQATSADLKNWHIVAASLMLGDNPYSKTGFLNWPPFWMELLFCVMKISLHFNLDFVQVLRSALIGADLTLLVATFWLLRVLNPGAPYFALLLFGYCINPLPTLQTIQHGNFDSFAAVWIVVALTFLIKFRRDGETIDWLWAAACLGMGGFTKTFPLFLWPLLAPGAMSVSWRAKILGACLLAGPVALSLTPLYVLNPDSISANVLHYHSFGSSFGLIGLLRVLGHQDNVGIYGVIFPLMFLAALVPLAIFLCKRPIREDRDVILLAVLILIFPFTFGTGFGPQYWIWVIAPWLVCCRQFSGAFGKFLVGVGILIVATVTVDYAVVPWLGDLGYWMTGSEKLKNLAKYIYDGDLLLAKMHLAMTLATFAVFFSGIFILTRRRPA